MDGFNRFYNTLKSSTALPQQISPSDTIRKLTETLGNAPLVEDRKAALLGLKGLSRDWKADVGQAAIPLLLTVLETDAQEDVDMGKTVLETLNVLCEVEEKTTKSSRETPAGLRNTDRVLSTEKPFTALLSLLTQNHFHIRYFGIQFLSTLLSNRSDVIQKYILAAPGGVGRMVEFLDDPRELIQNEGLLLLRSLSASNADIQKLIAFEGVFERLFDVIHKEGGVAAGNVIVQDCLAAMVSLLWFNVSNQNFFREASCINEIAPLLLFPPANQLDDHSLGQFSIQFWPEQKVANVEVVLTLIRMLVSGGGDSRKTNQKSLLSSSVTRCLIELSLASNAPTQIKSNALLALADIMRDSPANQELFTQLLISPLIPSSYDSEAYPSDSSEMHWERAEPVPAILALVAMAIEGDPGMGVNATQPVGLRPRAAAVTVFENYVEKLPDVRLDILSSMTISKASSDKPSPQTSGTVLLNGLRSFPSSSSTHFDSHASFFSCILLSHLLRNTESCKRLARETIVSSSRDDDPTSEKQAEAQNPDDNDEFDRMSLVNLVIGNLMFAQREYGTPAGQIMSEEWTRVMVGYIILLSVWMWESPKTVKEFLSEGTNLEVLVRPILQANGVDSLVQGLCAFLLGIVYEYNREQTAISREKLHHFLRTRVGTDQFVSRIHRLREDPRFRNVTPDVLELFDDKDNEIILEYGVWFDWSFVEFLKNNYLAAQRSILLEPGAPEDSRLSMDDSETAELVASLRSTIANATREQESLKQKITLIESEKEREVSEKQRLSDELVSLTAKLSSIESEHQAQQNSQSLVEENLRKELNQVKTDNTHLNTGVNETKAQLERELEEAHQEIQSIKTLKEKLETEITELKSKESAGATQITSELSQLKIDFKELQTKESETQKEQEDLLVLLEEISNKRKADKERMRAANIDVSEDEDEEEGE